MCLIYFNLFLYLSVMLLTSSLYLLIMNLSYILEVNFLVLNSSNIFFVILIDWMSLMFMSFVLFISSMVIYYSEEERYMVFQHNQEDV